jgi:MFS family permease
MLDKFYFLMTSERTNGEILIVTSLGSFLVPYIGSSITVALPARGAEFGLDAVMPGWISAAYIISAAIFVLPSGRFPDIIGPKRIFLSGLPSPVSLYFPGVDVSLMYCPEFMTAVMLSFF